MNKYHFGDTPSTADRLPVGAAGMQTYMEIILKSSGIALFISPLFIS